MLNSKWRTISQQARLYAYQLSQCTSYSTAHHGVAIPDDEESLPRLRRLFAREAKRNLFDAYLRPRETVINLVSTSISSSSAPGGEAFHFVLSPRGHYVLAYSSSRIHVIDVTGPELVVKRELKILRRPASTTITDDGVLLAVLSMDLKVDLYDLSGERPRHTLAVAFDQLPRTIALSPTGSVLAAAFESGVEVSSLDPDFASTARRSVKCYAADSLSFSRDGTQLLGTTIQSGNPSTVVITAPYFDPGGSLPEESVSSLWATSILFPNGSRDCSHSVLLPSSSDGEVSWTFTYDRIFETFRAVHIDDLRNGTTYFTGPLADSASASRLLPTTLPTASESGDLVASAFQGAIWLYGVPENLDASPNLSDSLTHSPESGASTSSTYLGRRNSAPSIFSVNRTRESISRIPQWQNLGDRFRNSFVEGRQVGFLDRVSALAWANTRSSNFSWDRLVVVAPGVAGQAAVSEDDGMNPVDGGRITLLDFDYGPSDGERLLVTIEVGMNEPEVLEGEHRDLDAGVAIVRRRSVAQRRGDHNNVSRSAAALTRSPWLIPTASDQNPSNSIEPRNAIERTSSQHTTSTERSQNTDEDQEAFDAPYSQTSPRSGLTLRRAATAAAVNRRFRPLSQEHIEHRRADGREEYPHESDADGWVSPPPPYSLDPLPPLPEHIQRSLLVEAAAATSASSATRRNSGFDFLRLDARSLNRSRTVSTVSSLSTIESRRDRVSFQRTLSDSTNVISDDVPYEENPQPVTSPLSLDYNDLYDVSPQITPQTSPLVPNAPISQITRRPVGTPAQADTTSTPSSPPPIMLATLQQPISPIPQPTPALNMLSQCEQTTDTVDDQSSWPIRETVLTLPERGTAHSQANLMMKPSMAGHTRAQSEGASPGHNQKGPPRPDETQRLLGPTSQMPVPTTSQRIVEPQLLTPRRSDTLPTPTPVLQDMDGDPLPIWKRAETAPITSSSQDLQNLVGFSMPSSDQLARLNARQGRPASFADPRRRSSSFRRSNPHRASLRNVPPQLTPEQAFDNRQAPRGASPQRAGASLPDRPFALSAQEQGVLSRRSGGNSHSRNPSTDSLSPRPPFSRLETIHSLSSANGQPSPYYVRKLGTVNRRPSRPERSAARNFNDAKKKGYRALRKVKNSEKGDGRSVAGWTNVSTEESQMDTFGKEKKVGKCVTM